LDKRDERDCVIGWVQYCGYTRILQLEIAMKRLVLALLLLITAAWPAFAQPVTVVGPAPVAGDCTVFFSTTQIKDGGFACPSSGPTLVVGATLITAGANNALLYNNGGVLGNTTALPNGTTATTQTTGDNSTSVATDAFVAASVPGFLPTLQPLQGLVNNGTSPITAAPGAVRIQLTANTTFYVNGSASSAACGTTGALTCGGGSDSVTAAQAQSASTPFLTLDRACAAVTAAYDAAGFIPTINLAHGSNYFSAVCFVNGTVLGQSSLFVQGDDTNQGAVTLTAQNGAGAFFVKDYLSVRLRSLTIADQGSALYGVAVGQGGILDLQNVAFSAFNSSACQIYGYQPGSINLAATGFGSTFPVTLNGGAGSFVCLSRGAAIGFQTSSNPASPTKLQVNIPSAVAYSNGVINAIGPAAVFGLTSTTFTGSGVAGTTGRRAILSGPVLVDTGGAGINVAVPGNASATLTNGAQTDTGDALTTPIPAADLPLPTASTLGGVKSLAAITNNFLTSIGTNGTPTQAQPACGNLSNSGTACQVNTGTSGATVPLLNAANFWSGVQTFVSPIVNNNVTTLPNALFLASAGAALFGLDGTNSGWASTAFGAIAINSFTRADGTAASPSGLVSGDEIGRLSFSGAESSTVLDANRARINAFAAENWSTTANGVYVSVFTTALTTKTTNEKVRFQASGGLSVGNNVIATDPGAGSVLAGTHILASGTTPSISSCGAGSPAVTGSDVFMKVTAGTGILTSCVVNFGTAFATAPVCQASSSTAIASLTVSASTTQVTIGGTSLTGDVIGVICGSTS
jgi:hypothetical protein